MGGGRRFCAECGEPVTVVAEPLDPMTTATAEMFLRQRDEALAEAERLRAENERLREALEWIAARGPYTAEVHSPHVVAELALGGSQAKGSE